MKVIITGAHGQLGRDLVSCFEGEFGYEVTGFSKAELDITDETACMNRVQTIKPDVIVHAAAYTAVDRAETEVEEAYRVNAIGSRNVAMAARAVGARVCLIGTDYVFDGSSSSSYHEYDTPNPINIYGRTKRAAELLVQSAGVPYFIVRTSWVYGRHGHNFVKTILRLAAEGKPLKVVDDQVGCPTNTVDLSRFLGELIRTEKYGIYHATNAGLCSWYEFAQAIVDEVGLQVKVEPCSTAEMKRPAARPMRSVLAAPFLSANGFRSLPPWRDSLARFIDELERGK